MDIVEIAFDCKPLQDLFKSILIQGTTEDPIFKLSDVAKYVDDDRPDRTTKDFDQALKVQSTYHDGKQNRTVDFLTEHGLYEYMMTLQTTKAREFKTMIVDILKQVRRQIIDRLTGRLNNVAEIIRDMPYPDDLDEQVQYRVATWTTRNIADTSAVHFPYQNVTKRTRDCIKKCIVIKNYGDIQTLMQEAYQEFYNLLILGIDEALMPMHEKYERGDIEDVQSDDNDIMSVWSDDDL